MRSENGEIIKGRTVSEKTTINLTGREGKMILNGKEVEYYEVTLPGNKDNTKYFVAKQYISIEPKGKKNEKQTQEPKVNQQTAKKSSETINTKANSDEISNEKYLDIKSNVLNGETTEVLKYTIKTRNIVSPDTEGAESAKGKYGEYYYIPVEEKNNFELYKKGDKFVLEMNGSGTFTDKKEYFDEMPSKEKLDEIINKMIKEKKDEGIEGAATSGFYEIKRDK